MDPDICLFNQLPNVCGKGNGNPHQYSCLENPTDRGAWWATVRGMQELDMSEQLTHTVIHSGLPWWLSGRESICNAGDMGSIPGPGDPWRKKWQPTPVFLPGKSHGQRSLVGYTPQGSKELDTTERLHFHLYE